MRDGDDVFIRFGDFVIKEYGHLAAPGYFTAIRRVRLIEWEIEVLDDASGGTTKLQQILEEDIDVFKEVQDLEAGRDFCASEARAKYQYLVPAKSKSFTSFDKWVQENGPTLDMWVDDDENAEAVEAFITDRYMDMTKGVKDCNLTSLPQYSRSVYTAFLGEPRSGKDIDSRNTLV